MRVVSADETGLVKRVEFGHAAETAAVIVKYRGQDRTTAPLVASFDRGSADGHERSVLLGLADGSIELLDLDTSERSELLPPGTFAHPIVGVDGNADRLVAADESGTVKLWTRDGDTPLADASATFSGSPHATRMVVCPDDDRLLAIGGKDCELRVWNLEDRASGPLYKSKNVKPDKLYLHAPKHDLAIAFVPGTEGSQLVVGTAYKQVRRYDFKTRTRPMFSVTVGEHAVSCVCATPDGKHIVAGDVAGGLFLLNHLTGVRIGKFKGVAGACRWVACHPTLDLMACCGLDRHVKIYSIKTRACRRKIYLKQRLNVVLFTSDEDVQPIRSEATDGAAAADSTGAQEEGDEDEVWTALEQLEQSKDSKKHAAAEDTAEDTAAAPKRRRKETRSKNK